MIKVLESTENYKDNIIMTRNMPYVIFGNKSYLIYIQLEDDTYECRLVNYFDTMIEIPNGDYFIRKSKNNKLENFIQDTENELDEILN